MAEQQQEDVPTPRNTTSTVEDLITLPVLDEGALLQNIKIRFHADLIYVCFFILFHSFIHSFCY